MGAEPGDDVGADIAAAMKELSSGPDSGGDGGGAGSPVEEAAGGAGQAGDSSGASEQPGEVLEVEGGGESAAAARARDTKGRFATAKEKAQAGAEAAKPKVAAKTAAGPGTQAGSEGQSLAPAPAVQDEATGEVQPPTRHTGEPLRPPQSWKPQARELWQALPHLAQQEIHRREKEAALALQESAPARKEADAWREVVAPFEAAIRSEGGEPRAAVRELLQTAAMLRGPNKAAVVARLVRAFNVPIDALDAALVGEQPQGGQGQPPPGEYRDSRLDALLGHLERAAGEKQQASAQKAQTDIAAFAEKAEYFEDVRHDMAALLSEATRRKQQMSLQEAYDRACWASSDIRPILQKRDASTAAKAKAASTQQARAAASSVKGQPTGAGGAPQSGSVEEDIRAAMQQLSGR